MNLPLSRIPAIFLAFVAVLIFLSPLSADAQIIKAEDQKQFTDSLVQELDYGPFFGLYKDNYFTVGMPIGTRPTAKNCDVKFQISLAIRLTKASLPWHTYLFLMYTQKTFWNVFENSMPMRDLNFNPGLGWSRPFFNKGKYVGKATILIEHESNGRDGEESRSWNKISLYGSVLVTDWLMVHAKYWIPIVDGQNNKDILKYSGIFITGFVASTPDKKFSAGLTLTKRKGWNMNFNTIVDFMWKVHEESNLNLFAQYYNGYGENLLDYNKFHSRFRVGILFKPDFFSEF